MTTQTSVQRSGAIRFGSGKIEVGTSVNTLVDIGAIKNAVFSDEFAEVELKSDNAGVVYTGVKDQVCYLEADMMEINFENLNVIRGGLDTYGTVAAAPVSVSSESHVLTDTDSVRLLHRNGAGTEVGSIVVVDASDNAATRNTDYVIAVDDAGFTCIARVAGSTVITDGDTAKVSYSYTPNAAITYTSGGKTALTNVYARVTNTDDAGDIFRIDIYKCTVNEGMEIAFPADDADDPAMPHLKLKGVVDATRTVGDQLFSIYDEQGV